MRVLDLRCVNCGAPLDIPARRRNPICEFCGSRLRIDFEDGQARIAALEGITGDLGDLRRQGELQQLDSDWIRSRDRYTVGEEGGRRSIPSAAGTLVGMTIAVVFAITWIVLAARMGAPAIFIAFGLFFIATVLLGGFRSLAKARAYQRDRRSYVARRQSLLRD
jgi:hypothetical protein